MDTQTQKLMFSSKSDEWETPEDFYNKLKNKFKFTLDPCSTHENHKCDKYYTMEDDGLSKSWQDEIAFVNPPYGDIGKWVKKAYEESTQNNAIVVMLIPCRTDTKYWHDYVMKGASKIFFVKGRLRFQNNGAQKKTNAAPFPSVVVVFGGLRWSPGPSVASLERL